MNINDCIKTRRSVRDFNDKAISRDVINEIITDTTYSPSWKNTQTPRFTIVEDRDVINNLADNCVLNFEFNSNTMKKAPMLVVVSIVKNRCGYERDGSFTTSKEDRWEMFDAGIATQTLALSAHSRNVGAVVLGIFDENKVAEAISLPEGEKVGAMLALGYYDVTPEMPKRKPLEDVVRYL